MKTVICLPFPISVNAMYANGAHGGRFKSQKYRAWCAAAGVELMRQRPKPVHGLVVITHELQLFTDNRRRDCANYEKGVTDLLVEHRIIEGDDQRFVWRNIQEWNPEVEGVRVTIEEFAASHFRETKAA